MLNALILAATIVAVQPPGGPGGPGGRFLPSTRAEAERMAAERFANRDANHDGFLTADELGERGAMMLERADADHDGKISAAESTGGMLAMFDRVDSDHDGTISESERSAMAAFMGGRRGPPPSPAALNALPATRAELERIGRLLFVRQDANHDGFLTPDELGERAEGALARLDADRDGKLSPAENGVALLALFNRVDADHDGTITDAERSAALAAASGDGPPQGN